MSGDQPELLRKLLGQDERPDAEAAPSPSGATAPQRQATAIEPDDPDLLPYQFTRRAPSGPPELPRGIARFGPSYWPLRASTPQARTRNVAIVALAVLGAFAGLFLTWYQLLTNPLGDAHAYFAAAVRLNAGQALYPSVADTSAPEAYRFPPLLATALRPITLLGWPAFAAIWEAIVAGSFVLLVRSLGAGSRTWLALGILAAPLGLCLATGQAQVPLTLLLAIGQPWSIALGANLGLFPALAALWWLGRRDGQAFGAFLAWALLIALGQTLLELKGSIDFVKTLNGSEVASLLQGSPLAVAPATWAILFGLGVIVTLILARTGWGWLAAVALSTLASLPFALPRLMGLFAGIREPEVAGAEEAATRSYQPVIYGRR